MIREATQALLTTLQDPAADEGRVRSAAQALMNAVRRASREEVAAAMRELSAAFALPDLQRAGFAAMLCGALVEGGFDPSPVAGPLMERGAVGRAGGGERTRDGAFRGRERRSPRAVRAGAPAARIPDAGRGGRLGG